MCGAVVVMVVVVVDRRSTRLNGWNVAMSFLGWFRLTPCPLHLFLFAVRPRRGHTAFVMDGLMYVFGGGTSYRAAPTAAELAIFDPTAKTWSEVRVRWWSVDCFVGNAGGW